MKRILTILFLLAGLTAFGQTYKTTTSVLNDSTTLFRSGTYTANLDNRYAKIEDGLISGGTATTNGDSLIVASGIARINSTKISFIGRTFADIAPSSVGLIRILIIYANTSGTLDSIAGAQSNNPVEPTLPSNTVRVITVNVSDAGLGVPTVDLSGYAKLFGGNTFVGNQNINDSIVFNKNTDIWKQYLSGNTDTPSGDLVFQSGDNGDEGFVFKTFAPASITGFTDSTFLKIKNPQIELHLNSKFYGKAQYNSDMSGTYTIRSLIDKGYADLTYQNKLSGTTNFIPKFTATSSLGNSQIFDNGTNVNIGTILGSEKLNVNGNVFTDAIYKSSSEIGLEVNSISGTAGQIKYTNNSLGVTPDWRTGILGAKNYSIFDNSVGGSGFALTILQTSGNIGIGTTSINEKLTINGNARATNFGANISPNANFGFTGAASTSTTAPFLITPGVAYTGTQNGALHYVSADSTLRMYRFNSSDQVLFNNNNKALKGGGVGSLIADNNGNISKSPIADRLTANDLSKSANYTVLTSDFGANGMLTIYVNTSGGDVTITLPSPTNMRNLEITVIKTTAGNNVIISGSANINGSASITESAQYKSYTLVSNGTQYYIKGERP